MKRFIKYLYKNKVILTITFILAFIINFLFSLLFLAQDFGNLHYSNLWESFRIIAVVPNSISSLELKVLEEKIYTNKATRDIMFVAGEQGWQDLLKDKNIIEKFSQYASNSLPHLFIIYPEIIRKKDLMVYIAQLKELPGVKEIIYDKLTFDWLGIFGNYLNYIYIVFLMLSSIMIFCMVVLSISYLLIKHYARYIPLLGIQGFAGFCGGIFGFL
ncbi:MAG: permease-like cell division protein FtsX [bacterium]